MQTLRSVFSRSQTQYYLNLALSGSSTMIINISSVMVIQSKAEAELCKEGWASYTKQVETKVDSGEAEYS